MKNWWPVAAIVIVFATAVIGAFFIYQKQVATPAFEPSALPSPTSNFPSQPTEGQTLPAQTVPDLQPATGITSNDNNALILQEPASQTTITSPVRISGWTKIDQSYLIIKIKDAAGNLLGQSSVTVCSGFQVCPFETQIRFNKPTTPRGIIEIFSPVTTKEALLLATVVQFK